MFAESMLIQDYVAEQLRARVQAILLHALRAKFGEVPAEVAAQVHAIADVQRLDDLNAQVGICSDLDAFRARLAS